MKNNHLTTGNWFVDQLSVYQSANSDSDSIKRNFIIRKAEFELIISDLLNKDADDPLQHELILGRRGSGKSTLLKRLQIEIEENEELSSKYVAINLAEEQAGIYRLFDLWMEILKELSIKLNQPLELKDYFTFKDNQAYTKYLYTEIHKQLSAGKKKAVLMLDNFDRIVENFDDDGNLLREILLNFNDIQIIGGSTRMDEHFWKYDKPFYEFFRRHRLGPLSSEEIDILLNYWSKLMNLPQLAEFTKQNKGKIEALRILTDGLPRTLQFFIQILLQDSTLYGYEYIKKVMDSVTPIYQERLNHLPAPQRKIVLEVAFLWESCSSKQLAEKSSMESKLISAHLKQLSSTGIIETIATKKKNHLYRLSERFFNMWLMVTQGNPEQKRKAKWLTIFLETWYDANQLKHLATQHIKNLQADLLPYDRALILTKALSQSKHTNVGIRDEMLEITKRLATDKHQNSILELPRNYREIISEINYLLRLPNFKRAHEVAEELDNEDGGTSFFIKAYIYNREDKLKDAEKYYLLAIENGNENALNNLALIYDKQEKLADAENYYLLAVEKGDKNAILNLALFYDRHDKITDAEKYYLLAVANGDKRVFNNLALFYDRQDKLADAEKYYLLAVEKGDLKALNNLGNLYDKQGKIADAEKYYLLAVEKGDENAMFNLGLLYSMQDKIADAEKYYLLAIEKGNFNALNNLGNLYDKQGKIADAEKYYLLAVEKGDENAMFNLALFYNKQDKLADAEKYYLLAVEKGDIDALNNLGNLYDKQGKIADAEKYYLLAVEKGDENAIINLALLYDDQGKIADAEKYYLLAIEKGDFKAFNNLALLYIKQDKVIAAEKYFNLAIEKGDENAILNLALFYDRHDKITDAEKYYLLAVANGDKRVFNNLALFYDRQDKLADAEKYFLLAIENGDENAIFNLALFYDRQDKIADAEKYFLLAVEKGDIDALNNLGNLYDEQGKIADAEKYYLLAVEKGDENAMFNLALFYYMNNRKKKQAIDLIGKIKHKKINQDLLELETILEIWNGIFTEFDKKTERIISESLDNNLTWFIENLLVLHQTQFVLKLFTDSNYSKEFQEKYTLLYYVVLLLSTKEDIENLKLRIAPEVLSTVLEIVEKIKNTRKIYSK